MNSFLKEINKVKNQFKIKEHIIPNENFELIDNLYQGAETRIVEKFNCLICLKIVNDPIKCKQCSKLFCEICINNSLKKRDRCPHCICSPFKKENIDLLVKDLLNESRFNCPLGCGKIIKYCEQESHKSECKFIDRISLCSLCGLVVEEGYKITHKEACEVLKCKCINCNEIVNKLDYQIHLNKCPQQINFCNDLKIYYAKKYEQAYKNEFQLLFKEFYSFNQEIKNFINENR